MSETAEVPVPDDAGTPPQTGTTPSRRRRVVVGAVGSLAAFGVAAGAVVAVQAAGGTAGSAPQTVVRGQPAVYGWGRGPGSGGFGYGGYGGYGYGGGSTGFPGSTGGSTGSATGSATAAQEVGIVDIDTTLGYQGAEAAGTGMILTSGGEILTNNHVVDGATGITVTVVSTGATYSATVVGTDPTADVAVLQLSHASGLRTARISSTAVHVGDAVTAVGNAGGTGGTPSAASGTVVALDRSITASDETGSHAEQLSGLIQTDADVQAGDSGGPLYDSSGAVVGMDTAASSGGNVQGYAIPIARAEAVARQIENGVDNATVHQGYPAFLGVAVQDGAAGGAAVSGVVSGGPADSAGIAAGDVITAVGGTPIGSASDLTAALAAHDPGQKVTVTWTDSSGTSRTATVSLATGPAD